MSRTGVDAIQLWTQMPVARRLIEVNTKTGFSLTAGSYSVRASSTQRGLIIPATSITATISSVTDTRTNAHNQGGTGNASVNDSEGLMTFALTNATTVTAECGVVQNAGDKMTFEVTELF